MTRSELEGLAQQWISLWCVPTNWELFDILHSDEFQDLSSADRASTKKAFAAGLSQFTSAFPDLTTKVEDMVVDELRQRIAIRWSSEGTNKSAFLGFGPTDRKTIITGIEIIEISNGLIVKRWGEWDIGDHQFNAKSNL